VLNSLGFGFTWVTTILAAPVLGLLYVVYAPVALLLFGLERWLKRPLSPRLGWQWVCASKVGSHISARVIRWIVFVLWRVLLSIFGILLWVVIDSGVWLGLLFAVWWVKVLLTMLVLGAVFVVTMQFVPLRKPVRVLSQVKAIPRSVAMLVAGAMGWSVLLLILLNSVFTNVGPLVRFVALPVARSMGCDVTLEQLDVCPLEGRLSVQGLRIENPRAFIELKPEVYKEEPLMKLDEFTVHVDLASLFKDGAFSTQDVRVHTFTLRGMHVLVAWDTLKVEEGEFVVTNIDALLIQMGRKPLPTPEVVEAEEQEKADAEEQATAEQAAVEAEQAEMVSAKEAELNQQLDAVKEEVAQAVAEGEMTQAEADARVQAEERSMRDALEAYKAQWKTNVTVEKLTIANNRVTFYWGHTFLPIDPRIPVIVPSVAMENVSTEDLRKTYEPIIDTMIEVYDLFDGFRLNLVRGVEDVFAGLADFSSEVLAGVDTAISNTTEAVIDGASTATTETIDAVSTSMKAVGEILFNSEMNRKEKKAAMKQVDEGLDTSIKEIKQNFKEGVKSTTEQEKEGLLDRFNLDTLKQHLIN
jgi:hypothetical protein